MNNTKYHKIKITCFAFGIEKSYIKTVLDYELYNVTEQFSDGLHTIEIIETMENNV
jgi:hypothetical protein